jgi:hypothetical protein
MVLGVDDLNQEFAYHSQRDQWTARDVLGYGTVWGLQVTTRDAGAPRGFEVVVSSGVAINPRGQLMRVAPAQCAALNEWMAARTAEIEQRRIPTGTPNLFQLPLYVVLSYRDCLTDPVPIAGEPCRSEQDATKPSRLADDFLLELAFDPPPQQEEDAIRDFVSWLRAHITVTGGGVASHSIAAFLDGIRAAAAAAAALVASPPGSGPILIDSSPPAQVSVPAALLPDYLRAALRLWVTELRRMWRPSWLGERHGCAGDELFAAPDQGNRLLLAALTVPIVPPALGNPSWVVASGGPAIVIDEDARPYLLHLRFLQEWLIAQGSASAAAGPTVVAAGVISGNTVTTGRAIVNGLQVLATAALAAGTQLRLGFVGYTQPPTLGGPQYLVKALPWPGAPIANLTVSFAGFQNDGFLLLVSKGGAALAAGELNTLQLMVEVSQYA